MPNITMQNVADAAGVSLKTVSRVVNKEGGVKSETREKVSRVIAELDYQPNPSARNLASARSYLVGLMYDNPNSAYIIGLQNGALATCRRHGFELLIHPCNHQDGDLVQKIRAMARQSRIDGLILSPPLCDMEDLLGMLDERGLAYVRISPLEHNERSPIVYADEYEASYKMTAYLITQGHYRIGFITGHPNRSGTEMRMKGYRHALRDNAIEFDESLVEKGLYTFESGEAGARRLLRSGQRPTAIFASNDLMAAGVLKVAHQMKIRMPYELSVCGYDDAPLAERTWPRLTTIRHPVEQVAEQATSLLIRKLNGEPAIFDPDSIQSELVIRESTGPLVD
ncbi:MAG: LacI family DNA-binding transcriptional regulator [Lysobacterales bacterium]|jgi:LacI family transcriptional regulator